MRANQLHAQITADVFGLLSRALDRDSHTLMLARTYIASQRLTEMVTDDLEALALRDAAAKRNAEYVYESYCSFRCVFAHRLAHLLHVLSCEIAGQRLDADVPMSRRLKIAARRISEAAKVESGIEIHPAASIGRRLVIDHGSGTVIGEQAELGDDCYLLQGVVIGGISVGMSSAFVGSRRHPRIGHRVEMAAGAMVLGPVTIGDDCRLEAGVRVTTDIPSHARVKLVSTIQISLLIPSGDASRA